MNHAEFRELRFCKLL